MTQLFANNAESTLSAGISAVALSLTLQAGHGARFPALSGSDYFYATLYKVTASVENTREVVKVTARVGDVLTIVRAQEGTTAAVFATDDYIQLRATAATFSGMEQSVNKDASAGYVGLTLFKHNCRNAANTITSFLTNAATVARTWTFPDKDGTVAMLSDITGTNSGTNTGDATATTHGALIAGATAKTTPVDADYLGLMDSAASNVMKKVSWAAVKATLKTYFDTLYAATGSGGSETWVIKTGNYTAVTGDCLMMNTTAGQLTLTLPASPVAGTTAVKFADYARTFQTNKLIINPNGNLFEGASGNQDVTTKNASGKIVYIDATQGYKIVA